ncbi:PQQ-dependent sugar dehydrogenase [Bavariicoccus seileri]|uniref:PQQ-dependent sugar dehydrogenase n=1 Tax=Bavariicoccus seileri TaxID=549685 RepID=UPI000420B896|nr:PQQ-dependent sugar dehydrogenase [Bavariicoccus seileri]
MMKHLRRFLLMLGVVSFLGILTGCSSFNDNHLETPQNDVDSEQSESSGSDDSTNGEDSDDGNPTTNELTVVASDLDAPWSIQKAGERFYISERDGAIVTIIDGEVTRQPVQLEKELAAQSEAGFMGFVLAPDFEDSQEAYAYYTYQGDDGTYNRIVTIKLTDNEWQETGVLLDNIPSGNLHAGGRLAIGPDDKLYATVGDIYEEEIAQDKDSLNGKILRLELDGSIPSDNPFEDSYVYSYGHRNPQGLTWLSDGTFYASEHGSQANDEINRIEAGKNYGWPMIEGDETNDDMETPIVHSGSSETWAPSGLATDDDSLYIAALRGNAVLKMDLADQTIEPIVSDVGRIRDVIVDGDYLYFISNNTDGRGNPSEDDDKLYRIGIAGE